MGRLVKTTLPDSTHRRARLRRRKAAGTTQQGPRRTDDELRVRRARPAEEDDLPRRPPRPRTPTTRRVGSTGPKDARGKTTSYEYDAAGRRTKVRAPLSAGLFAETSFTYDANGNQKTVTDAEGHTTDYVYDALEPPDEDDLPAAEVRPAAAYTDDRLRRARPADPETDQAGKMTQFRVRRARPADGGRRRPEPANAPTATTSSATGSSQTDANGHTTRFVYDKLGRQTDAHPARTASASDELRRRRQPRDPHRLHGPGHDLRLRRQQPPRCPAPTRTAPENVSFTLHADGPAGDGDGRRGTTSYGYDLRDRLDRPDLPRWAEARLRLRRATATARSLTATMRRSTRSPTTSYTYDDAEPPGHRDRPRGPRLRPRLRPERQPHEPRPPERRHHRLRLRHPEPPDEPRHDDAPCCRGRSRATRFTLGPAGNRTQDRRSRAGTAHARLQLRRLYRLTSETVTEHSASPTARPSATTPSATGRRRRRPRPAAPADSSRDDRLRLRHARPLLTRSRPRARPTAGTRTAT